MFKTVVDNDKTNEYFMNLAYKEAKKAYLLNEIPIGAVIIKDNKIIAKGYNKRERSKLVTAHAEILAITKACKKLKTWRLEDCTIFVTMEPCMMCMGAILQARFKCLVYGASNDKFGYFSSNNHLFEHSNIFIVENVMSEENTLLIQNFFKEKR